jgi:hypothetical protein
LTFIHEIRIDNASQLKFVDTSSASVKSASQVCLAVVYVF